MPKYRVTSPEGSVFEVNAPDGASEADVMAYAKTEFAKQVPAIEKPAAVKAGDSLKEVPRQVGLAARYGMEGLAQVGEIVTEPVRQFITDPLLRAARGTTLSDLVTGNKPQSRTLGQEASRFADTLGLPKPEGANERVVADASRLVAGAGGMTGLARTGAATLSGVAGNVMGRLATGPGQQAAAAAGAGLAGGSVREAGGSPVQQFGASLAGGVASPTAMNMLSNVAGRGANIARNALTPQRVIDQQVDQQIELTLRQSGIDWAGVSERIKQGMRADVAQAVSNGERLDPAATARLLQFRMVPGTQPTRGMISQDPVQITREQNLAKVGANSLDVGLQRLPNLQSSNTSALLRNLDEAGAAGAPDSFEAGRQGINALQGVVNRRTSEINQLYSAARDTSGRSLPLDGATFARTANETLQRDLAGKLPTQVENAMNDIAMGKTPLTVEYAEQLKTMIGRLQRNSADGNERHALGVVRRALDQAPLRGSERVNPGNLPAVPGTVPPSTAGVGEESIAAFNAARRANREWMGQIESTPALRAVVDGVEPDQFVRQFITGSGASVGDVRALREAAGANPEALQAIKQHLVAHLRGAATGQADDINKFRADSYNNALNSIGERKLSAFFSPEEIARLRAVGNVSNYASAQPAGTAVNNSNSGALVMAKVTDILDSVAGKMPLGLNTAIQGTLRGVQQRQVMNPANALRLPAPATERPNMLLPLPLIAVGQGANDR